MTDLVNRSRGINDRNDGVYDPEIEDGGISINQDAYDPSLDRIYETKGMSDMHVEIENTGASGLVYTIQNARKEFIELTELVDADFDNEILADTIVASAAKDLQDIINLSPESTAIRIRIRRETPAVDTTMAGIVSTV